MYTVEENFDCTHNTKINFDTTLVIVEGGQVMSLRAALDRKPEPKTAYDYMVERKKEMYP